jgi:hypothetical protein
MGVSCGEGSGHLLHRGDGAVDLEGLGHSHSAIFADHIARETEREREIREREREREGGWR